MTLSRIATFRVLGLAAGLALLGAASLWGLVYLQHNVRLAQDAFQELRFVQNAVGHATEARHRLETTGPDDQSVLEEIEARDDLLNAFFELQQMQDTDPDHAQLDRSEAMHAFSDLRETLKHLDTSSEPRTNVRNLERAIADVEQVAQHMDTVIARAQQDASDQLQFVTVMIVGLAGLLLIAALYLTVAQHRSIIAPLRRLRESTARMAAGDFQHRVHVTSSREFMDLAADFNRMADELDGFYRQLEEKVQQKSRELVRSERLASVGFLGAGVAHEINNPLGIIAGHAELLLRQLDKSERPMDRAAACAALQIVRDEAFRCRDIIQKLISLARPGETPRLPVPVYRVANDVVAMVGFLKQSKGRRIIVETTDGIELWVAGNEPELKQVLLNLVVNGLEAVDSGGEVRLAAKQEDGWINVSVSDNGVGMSPEALEHAFEPFFRGRRGGERGLGLGLSISHAIIEAHGGRITAESAGLNHGSRFTIRLPAAKRELQNGRNTEQTA
ncbi:MAG: HAMP domain-containing protein [Planctomycetes bacterium]|nr:HAMP domain-containing protein [Planctomycetota bacterium]MBI3834851.1 HAMP domain-containing protein [Planctomycetota bacterium]